MNEEDRDSVEGIMREEDDFLLASPLHRRLLFLLDFPLMSQSDRSVLLLQVPSTAAMAPVLCPLQLLLLLPV